MHHLPPEPHLTPRGRSLRRVAARGRLVLLGSLLALSTGCSPGTGSAPSDGVGGQPSGGARGASGAGGAVAGGSGGGGGALAGNGGVAGGGQGGAGNGGVAGGSGQPGTGGVPNPTNTGGAAGSIGGAGGTAGQCGRTLLDPTTLPPCSTCTGGRCVTTADFPGAPVALLDQCGAGSVCMPDPIVATKGNVLLAKCASVSGAEGRCASLCIPIVRSLSTVLPQSSCGASDRCAPCYNPSDGQPTGICKVGCDPGPTSAPFIFPQCCGARGQCVPRADIPGAVAKMLPTETCKGTNDPVCVPTKVIKDPTYKFPPCTVDLPLAPGSAGVCAPDCIVNAVPNGNLVGRGTCADPLDKCAPCKNPLDGSLTGACP